MEQDCKSWAEKELSQRSIIGFLGWIDYDLSPLTHENGSNSTPKQEDALRRNPEVFPRFRCF
jgi:hypothetical protein